MDYEMKYELLKVFIENYNNNGVCVFDVNDYNEFINNLETIWTIKN